MTAPQPPSEEPAQPRWRDSTRVRTVALLVIAAAAGWYLMLQLAPILRPLLIAAFLAYVLMPYHSRLRHRVGTPASLGILAGTTCAFPQSVLHAPASDGPLPTWPGVSI